VCFKLTKDININIRQDVLVRTNRLLSFESTRTTQETAPPTILRCRGNVFTELLPSNDRGIHRLSFVKTRTAYIMAPPTNFLLLRVFVAAGTCVTSRCLATMRGGEIHIQTHRLMEVRSGAIIYFFFPLALQPNFGPRPTSMKLSVSLWFTRS
jgi:hypothetical protein